MPVSEIYVESLHNAPVRLEKVDPELTYTLPDMHGNAMYMLYVCGLLGIVEFEQRQWDALWQLYEKPSLQAADFESFTHLVRVSASWDFYPSIRLIGDLLADRGRHDQLMLIVLEHIYDALHLFGKSFEIIYSNHDHMFMRAFATQFEETIFEIDTSLIWQDRVYVQSCYRSLEKLQQSIKAGHSKFEEIERMVQKVVFPNLKLLNYEVIEGDFYLFSHAPTCQHTLSELVKGPIVPLKTHADLAELVKSINKNLYEKYNSGIIPDIGGDEVIDFVQARGSDILSHCDQDSVSAVVYVHGHTGEENPVTRWHMPIDGNLGRPNPQRGDGGLLTLFAAASLECDSSNVISDESDEQSDGSDFDLTVAGNGLQSVSRLSIWLSRESMSQEDTNSVSLPNHDSRTSPFKIIKSS